MPLPTVKEPRASKSLNVVRFPDRWSRLGQKREIKGFKRLRSEVESTAAKRTSATTATSIMWPSTAAITAAPSRRH